MSKLVCLRNFPVSGDRVLFSSNLIYSIFRSLPANFKMFLCFRNMSFAGLGIRSLLSQYVIRRVGNSLFLSSPFRSCFSFKKSDGSESLSCTIYKKSDERKSLLLLSTKRVTKANRSCLSVCKVRRERFTPLTLFAKRENHSRRFLQK